MSKRTAPAWERREGETARAFWALRLYLDGGPRGTLADVAKKLGHRNAKTVEKWSRKNEWVARRAAYLDATQRSADDAMLDEIEKRTREHAEVLGVAIQASAAAPREVLRRLAEDEALLRNMPIAELLQRMEASTRALARAIPVERLVRGLSTDAPDLAGGREAARKRIAAMTPAELVDVLTGAGVADLEAEREARRK